MSRPMKIKQDVTVNKLPVKLMKVEAATSKSLNEIQFKMPPTSYTVGNQQFIGVENLADISQMAILRKQQQALEKARTLDSEINNEIIIPTHTISELNTNLRVVEKNKISNTSNTLAAMPNTAEVVTENQIPIINFVTGDAAPSEFVQEYVLDNSLNNISENEHYEQNFVDVATNEMENDNKENWHPCCSKVYEIVRVNNEQLRILSNEIGVLKEILENRAVGEIGSNETRNYNLLPKLPITTEDDLDKFSQDLENNEALRNQFKNYIKSFGGKKEKCIKYALSAIIADILGTKVNWVGKNAKKMSIMYFTKFFIDCFVGVEGLKKDDVEKVFKDWLRRSGDRLKKMEQ